MGFDFAFALKIWPTLLNATKITLLATFIAFGIAMIGGGVLLAIQRGAWRPVARALEHASEFIRNTPILVQLYFAYFLGPQFGLNLPPLETGCLVLGIHYSCFMAEVYRAGLEAIPRTQFEAAVALNLGRFDLYARVVAPQAVPIVLPNAGNLLIYMFKDTPFLAAISVAEMMQAATRIGSDHFRYLEPITICGIIFLALSLLSSLGVRLLERRVGRAWR